MNTRFLFKGVDIDERTRDYILKRLGRLEKLVDSVSEFEVEIERSKQGKFRVEVMIKTPHNLYRAEETTESIEGSTDIVVDEVKGQLDKMRNKNHDLKLRGNRSIKKKLVLDESARF
jgi:putative sigma-54 modulation protein